jgi:hypothetical protein
VSRLALAAGDCQYTATELSCSLIGFQPRPSSDTSAGGEASVSRLAQAQYRQIGTLMKLHFPVIGK